MNEPWALVVGLLWGALALTFVRPARRRTWVVCAVQACLAFTVVGVLSGLGVVGSMRAGYNRRAANASHVPESVSRYLPWVTHFVASSSGADRSRHEREEEVRHGLA